MATHEQNLEKYAELVVRIGVNIQSGQVLHIESPLEAVELTRHIVKKAYQAGAKYVEVSWSDDEITRARYEYASDESFDFYPEWSAKSMEQLAECGGALLNIKVPNPELFKGIDSSKVVRAGNAAAKARKKFSHYTRNNEIAWCLVKAPTKAWADIVFADLPEEKRIDTMWETIFKMQRVDHDDPVQAWHDHIDRLKTFEDRLNEKSYKRLHYRAPGTDLSVELPKGHIWKSAGGENTRGVYFVANMPTEEVYSMPHRLGVNGTVTSTMPLNMNGRIVDKFSLTFKEGKVVEYTAEVGQEHLDSLFATDEGAKHLGEIALVPHDSPISNLNRIFYNTGIDENASCHFAVGSAYPVNIENGQKMTQEELLVHGANVSLTHVDFMVGCAELDIEGEFEDGTKEPVFIKGNWA
ncbi:aminopeptidase [Paenibacillus sp. N1-5-1-14]|uniref:aminopeptidase n=1 Tax=Paenibacillus radicibacter TaxID=2972488 RepID=UPI002158E427|nr:aminopeptidase [Paenibacillus radicibacter]MCR8641063.1 aminopeptidase [Paenibacillus radicibacter]